MNKITPIFWGAGLLATGALLGFGLAVFLARTEIQVDYDSGAIREVVSLGPIRVREAKYGHGFFGSIRMPNGRAAITGAENWHPALVFSGNSKRSPLLEGGQVLNDISKLEQLPWAESSPGISVVKQQFLESLAADGVNGASAIVRASEERVLTASENRSPKN